MPIQIKAPDGSIAQFPDGMSDEAISAVMAKEYPQPPSGLEAMVKNAANAATFGLGNTIAAAGDATIPLDSGSSKAATWAQRFRENRANQNADSAAGNAAHPVAAITGGLAGGFLNPVTRALPVVRGLGGAIVQGAGIGGAYGAGDAINDGSDATGVATGALKGAAAGGIFGAGFHAAGKLLRGTTQSADAALLNSHGVPTTIGQDLGGGFKRAEDAMTSIPLGGDAIIARQKEGIAGFNRALENNSASAVGMQVPATMAPGNDAGRYLNTMNKAAYDAAYNGATIQKTPQLVTALQSATDHFPSGLNSKSVQQDFNDRILNGFDANGNMSSKAFNDAKDWLAEQSDAGQTATRDQQNTAKAYANAKAALLNELSTQDPQRGAMLKAADTMYARRMPLVNAAKSTNANMKDGVVTPSQFSGALMRSDGSAHGLNYSLGNMPMQDMVQAGQRVLPSAVPDSGTALRQLLTGGLPTIAAGVGGGVAGGLPAVLPAAAAATLPMLATKALYTQAGQSAAKKALFGAPQTRAVLADLARGAAPGLYGLLGASVAPSKP